MTHCPQTPMASLLTAPVGCFGFGDWPLDKPLMSSNELGFVKPTMKANWAQRMTQTYWETPLISPHLFFLYSCQSHFFLHTWSASFHPRLVLKFHTKGAISPSLAKWVIIQLVVLTLKLYKCLHSLNSSPFIKPAYLSNKKQEKKNGEKYNFRERYCF